MTKKPFVPNKLPLQNLKWDSFIPLMGKANREIARFDALIQSMIEPTLLLAPLTTREAVLSSKIEGTQATLEEVLKYEANPSKDAEKYDDIQEVINYRKAMLYAVKDIEKVSLTLRLIRNIHTILLEGVRGQHKDRGNFRKNQVYIGKNGTTIEEATYIPPEANKIIDLLSNLEKYFHYEDKDYLVQLAIIHAQFEMIHPFSDGNGRVGRILMPLFLYHKKVLSTPMLYLSEYFEKNRESYYKNLLNISENNNWESWIEYFLNAVYEQSQKNIQKAKGIKTLYDNFKSKIGDITKSRFSIETLDFIFSKPFFVTSQFIKESRIPKASAMRIISILTENNVIKIIKKGKGTIPNLFYFPALYIIISK
jgi:Fic family protein